MRRLLSLLATGWLAACSPAGLLNETIATGGIAITRDVAYAPGPRRGLDVYRPRDASANLPLVVFLYGGSWRTGDKAMYPFVAATLARRGAVVMVPDYRLYPAVQYPAFLQDNALAVAWARAHAAQYGADPAAVFVMGHSAGAYDAAMLALGPALLAAAGMRPADLAGVIGLAGPYDFLPSDDPDVIPVFGADNTPAHQPVAFVDGHNPPMLLAAGTADTTVMPRNTTVLADRIVALGGPVERKSYPGVGHIGIIVAFAPVFSGKAPVLDDVWQFIEAHRPPPGRPPLDGKQALR